MQGKNIKLEACNKNECISDNDVNAVVEVVEYADPLGKH